MHEKLETSNKCTIEIDDNFEGNHILVNQMYKFKYTKIRRMLFSQREMTADGLIVVDTVTKHSRNPVIWSSTLDLTLVCGGFWSWVLEFELYMELKTVMLTWLIQNCDFIWAFYIAGEKPYKCNQCGRQFVSSGVLKAHLKTHTGLKEHKCQICQASFTTNGSLTRHMTIHSSIRPFKCPYCNETFRTAFHCKKHMRLHRFQGNSAELHTFFQKTYWNLS